MLRTDMSERQTLFVCCCAAAADVVVVVVVIMDKNVPFPQTSFTTPLNGDTACTVSKDLYLTISGSLAHGPRGLGLRS